MSSIDERVVAMKFNNAQFESGVKETTSTLDKFKNLLKFDGAKKGLEGIEGLFKGFSLANVASGVESVASKFTALGVLGITALSNLTNKAVDAGLQIAKSLTIDPIKAGFGEYELKMGSIQTILANTQKFGTTLPEVTGALDELNTYADKTIYNFGDMTKNIGLFTNAGIRIEDATSMIKGFSNSAAASGTNAQQAAGAAYQLSQALSAGKVTLMDWRSLQNAGMGNKNMQQGILDIAGAMGTLGEAGTSAEEVQANFNGSLEKGWLKADVMSNYLKIMAGDMTAAEQAALGLSDAQIANFKTQQATAEQAATKVRTYSQLMGTMKEAVASGWSETFDIIVGDFDQASEVFTAVNNVFGEIIGNQAKARNDLLREFAAGGGRDALIAGVANAWQALNMIITPIKSAFKEIFPPITAKNLVNIANGFRDFMKALQPSADTMKQLKRIFMGVFAVLDIGWMIIKQVFDMFVKLFTKVGENSGGFLEIAANIGDFLVKVRDAIKSGDGLAKIFETIGKVLEKPIELLGKIGEKTADFTAISSWSEAWEKVGEVFRKIGDAIKKAWDSLRPFFNWIKEAFENVRDAIKEFFKTMDFNVLVGLLNVGALAGVGVLIGKAMSLWKKGLKLDWSGGVIDKIKGVFDALTEKSKAMTQNIKADTLLKIAIAIGILALAIIALSFVDPVRLAAALGAITVMIGQLVGAMILLDKFAGQMKVGRMFAVGAAMMGLAVAILILAAAAKIFASMDWNELARGVVGMAVGLGILVAAMMLLQNIKATKMLIAGAAMILIATALVILAAAMKIFATMSWEDFGKGIAILAATLGVLALGLQLIHSKVFAAASLLVIAVALTILAGIFKIWGAMSWEEIGKAMVMLAGTLGILALGLEMLHSKLFAAVSLIIVAVAITILTAALKIFSKMSWEEIGKAMTMLAGSLAILAGAMALMGIPLVALGGLALFIVAAGMMMLAPALVLLGTMSWDAIGRGLAMLASALGILAVMGLLLIPASVGFLLLGAAILLLGTGVYLAGAGMVILAAGFVALAAAAALGSEQIKAAILTIISVIPEVMAAFAQGLIDFALVLVEGADEFLAAFVMLIDTLITAIGIEGPKIIETLWNLLMLMVAKIEENIPKMVDSGMKLLIGILDGIQKNLPKLLDKAGDVAAKFIEGLGKQAEKLAKAGGEALIDFMEGMADWIDNNGWRFNAAGSKLFKAIVNGVSNAIENGGYLLRWAGERIGNAILEGTKNALGINSPSKVFRDQIMPSVFEGVEDGNEKNLNRADAAGSEIGTVMMAGMKKSISDIASAVATDMDFTPTVTPILDLSLIKKDAGLIGGILTPPSVTANASYSGAASIASENRIRENYEANLAQQATPVASAVTFVQNNNSPKSLDNVEIYRQTRNQLSVARGALK